jgi:hypothetical protein
MAEKEYYRLTRSRRRPGIAVINISQYSLWLGRDHLLLIESNGYTETYKRFYFRDIQAIIARRTSARMITSIGCGVIGAMVLGIGFLVGETSAIITFAVIAGVTCLIPLWINLLLGPTCMCQIRTAVQIEDLPIRRLGKARKILERIRPLIAEAQGQLTPEEIQSQMQALAASPPAGATASAIGYVADEVNAPPRIIS